MRKGRLIYLSDEKRGKHNQRRISVKCDCGTKKEINYQAFKSGATISCGCLAREKQIERQTKHGKCNIPEYRVWGDMKNRCSNPNLKNYVNYGGRGITVCKEWMNSFVVFLDDMGLRPDPAYTLDRIDNEGNYNKDNCRWTDKRTQSINSRIRRNNRTGTKGVGFYKAYNQYRARIVVKGKKISLGYYSLLEDAIIARKKAEQKYQGDMNAS